MPSTLSSKLPIFGIAFLLLASFLLHFLFISYPDQVVFDEVHYGTFSNGYLSGKYFFDIHPPLGSLLITLSGWLFGYQDASFSFEHIGKELSNIHALRVLPALAGSFLPLAVYFLMRSLGVRRLVSFFAGLFILLENGLLAHTRLALPDAFLLLFGVLGLTFFFSSRRKNYYLPFLFLAGAFFAFSFSVKWTGLAFPALAALIFAKDMIVNFFVPREERKIFLFPKFIFLLSVIPFLLYFAVFTVHFALLPKAGPGDAFMSEKFRQGELNTVEKFLELNAVKYLTNKDFTATHPYGSEWHSWPLMARTVFYWTEDNRYIYLLGNPVVWWGSTMGIGLALLGLLLSRSLRKDETLYFLLAGYFVSFLPFMLISRVMFLYHYFIPLVFAILIFSYIIGKAKYALPILLVLGLASLVAFAYFIPLTYGFPLDDNALQNRMWLSSWR